MKIPFVILLFSNQISGRGKSFQGGAPWPPWKKARRQSWYLIVLATGIWKGRLNDRNNKRRISIVVPAMSNVTLYSLPIPFILSLTTRLCSEPFSSGEQIDFNLLTFFLQNYSATNNLIACTAYLFHLFYLYRAVYLASLSVVINKWTSGICAFQCFVFPLPIRPC